MREDDLLPPPVEDTITLLVSAARQAGFDVDPPSPGKGFVGFVARLFGVDPDRDRQVSRVSRA